MGGRDDLKTIHLRRYEDIAEGEDSVRYASVSKPYNRFYESEEKWVPIPEKTIFQTVFDSNQGCLDGNIIVVREVSDMANAS